MSSHTPSRLHLPRPPGRAAGAGGAGSSSSPAPSRQATATVPLSSGGGKKSRFPLPPPSPSQRSRIQYATPPQKQPPQPQQTKQLLPSQLLTPSLLKDDDHQAERNRQAIAAASPLRRHMAGGTPQKPQPLQETTTTPKREAVPAPARAEDGGRSRTEAIAQQQQQQDDYAAAAPAADEPPHDDDHYEYALPPGWVQLAADDGTPYYYRASDQCAQWERPEMGGPKIGVSQSTTKGDESTAAATTTAPSATAAAEKEDEPAAVAGGTEENENEIIENENAVAAETPLPPGWIELALNDGTPYYYRAADQTTQWVRPQQQLDDEGDDEEPASPAAITDEPAAAPAAVVTEETPPRAAAAVVEETAAAATEDEQQPPPPLPSGWAELVTNDGTPYFFRASDRATQWERPTETTETAAAAAEGETPVNEEEEEQESEAVAAKDEAAAAAAAAAAFAAADDKGDDDAADAADAAVVDDAISALPPGWIEVQTEDGTPYYYNENTQATQWVRPETTGPAAGAAAFAGGADESLVGDENAVPPTSAVFGLDDTTRDDSPQYDSQQEGMPPAEDFGATEEEEEEEEGVTTGVPSSPTAAAAAATAAALPPGWIEAETEDGTPYFYNEINQTTEWTRSAIEEEEEEPALPSSLASAEGAAVPNDAIQHAAVDTAGVAVDDQAKPSAVVEEEEGPQETSLPPGWIELATDDGTPYYYHEVDQITRWALPELQLENRDNIKDDELSHGAPEPSDNKSEISDKESSMPQQNQLPEGWIQRETDDGTPFYLFEAGGTTQWERPGLLPEVCTDIDAVVENNLHEMLPPAESEKPGPLEQAEEPAAAAVEDTAEGVLSTEEDSENLPPGWTLLQTEDGTPYYFHAADNRTTWERPYTEVDNAGEDSAAGSAFVVAEDSAEHAEKSDPEMETEPVALDEADAEPEEAATTERHLPDGWVKFETDEGVPYYMFEADGSTQWEFPGFVYDESAAAADPLDGEDAAGPTKQEEPLQYDSKLEEEIAVPPAEHVTAREEDGTEVQVAGGGLPPGWIQTETEDGTPYFYHELDQITQWTRPGEEVNEPVSPSSLEEEPASPSSLEKEPASPSTLGAVTPPNEPALQPDADAAEGGDTDDQAVPVPSTAVSVDDFGDGDVAHIEEQQQRGEVPLPPGWIEAITDDGTLYYYHELDQITQWDRPEPPLMNNDQQMDTSDEAPEPTNDDVEISDDDKESPRPQQAELPDGWIQLANDDGTPYYMYEPDGTTQWEFPIVANAAGLEEKSADGAETLAAGNNASECVQEQAESVEPVEPSVPLAPGWVRLATDDGTPYYMFEADGTTQWEAPGTSPSVKEDAAAVAAVAEDDAIPPETEEDIRIAAVGKGPTVAELESSRGDTKELLEAAEESSSLPDGWVQLVGADGTPYYMNELDGSTQWEPPSSIGPREAPHSMESIPEAVNEGDETNDEAAAGADEDLPAGWNAIVDENSGSTYYLFEDGTTTWNHPRSTAVGDAPDEPAAAPENTESPSFAAKGEAIDSSYVMVDDEDAIDELPLGWIKIVDDNSGLPYYLNEEDGTSQWDPPAFDSTPEVQDLGQLNENDSAWEEEQMAEKPVSAPEDTGHEQERSLPRGWTEHVDPDFGRSYFVEEATGTTSWERPVVQSTETVTRPPDGEEMRKAGRPAHTIASFGFGGRLCVLRNQGPKPNVVAVHRTCNVSPNERLLQIEYTKRRFGIVGPLNSANEESVKSYLDEKEASRHDLLWRLIAIASMFQGRLRSSDRVSSAGSPEAAIVELLLEDNDRSSSNGTKECSSKMIDTNHSSALAVEKLLLMGEQERAAEEAISSKNFALALLIASRCSQEHFRRTAQCFAENALTPGEPLHTIALLFGGSYDPSSWEKVDPAILLEKWKSNVAAVLNNRVDGWRQTILDLGDRLLELGDVIAAHVCFLACGCAVTNPVSHVQRLVLLGCNLNTQDLVLGSASAVEAFERTEAYEWAKRRGNPKACFTSLQAFKVMYAVLLVDFGLVDAAKAYINSILDCMESSLEDARAANSDPGRLSLSIMASNQEGLLATLGKLYDRLSGVTTTTPLRFDASLNNDGDTPSIRTEENVADSSFVTAKTNIEDAVSSPSKSSPRSKPNGSAGESHPLQPVGEDNAEPGLETEMPTRPSLSSREDYGTPKGHQRPSPLTTAFDTAERASSQTETPRQSHDARRVKHQSAPMSAPANLESAKKHAPSSTPSSGGFSSIKSWLTKKMNPDATQADLGEGMQAYYDKEKKVWVFPGEDPAEVAAPLPPPPKTPSEAAPAPKEPQTNNNESVSPLAAMMAPPKRNPSAARARAGVRPSPSSMPAMFSEGMMPPTPNRIGSGASAAPKVAVFQPKPNDGDGRKENEEPEGHK